MSDQERYDHQGDNSGQEENLSDALLLDQGGSPEDDAVYELMDNDPEVRAAVAREIKQRLMQQQQPAPAPAQTLPQSNELQLIRQRIEETEQWLDAFYEKPDTDKDYVAFQRKQDEIRRLERQERDLQAAQRTVTANLAQSSAWVDEWIQAEARQQKAQRGVANIERYAHLIKQLANQLPVEVRADRAKLNESLRFYLEPNAYKQYNESQANRRAAARREAGAHGEPGDASDERMSDKQDPYADASAEERQFLRGVGLLRDAEQPRKKGSSELIPLQNGNGYIIPIGRGKRNPERNR